MSADGLQKRPWETRFLGRLHEETLGRTAEKRRLEQVRPDKLRWNVEKIRWEWRMDEDTRDDYMSFEAELEWLRMMASTSSRAMKGVTEAQIRDMEKIKDD